MRKAHVLEHDIARMRSQVYYGGRGHKTEEELARIRGEMLGNNRDDEINSKLNNIEKMIGKPSVRFNK